MKKLTIKELAPYLPFSLNILDESSIVEMRGINGNTVEATLKRFPYTQNLFIEDIKPILRPLSDLTKEIEDGNIEFSYQEKSKLKYLAETKDTQAYQGLEYSTILFLCENHFDFQNLILKGLAIDINTLQNER